jgi:hypothetical protein
MILHKLRLFFGSFKKHDTNIFRATEHQVRIVGIIEDYILPCLRIGFAVHVGSL